MVLTIPFGFRPGDGVTGHIGGGPGVLMLTMIITPGGGHTDLITRFAIRTGFIMHSIFTGLTELRR